MSSRTNVRPEKKSGASVVALPHFVPRRSAHSPSVEDRPVVADAALGHNFGGVRVHAETDRAPASCPLSPVSPRACPFGGACHACPPRLQAKLAIGQPGDAYEQEADRVAEEVMRMAEPPQRQDTRVSEEARNRTVRRKCARCEDDEESLQKKEPSGQRTAVSDHSLDVPPIVHEMLRSPGEPLDPETRAFMESRFVHDFSQVRVHSDGTAAESARTVSALAYTVGRHVAFAAGRYAPATDAGRRLLAHELSHVVQQVHTEDDLRQTIQRKPNDRPEVRPDVAFVLQSDLIRDAKAIAPHARIVLVETLIHLNLALKKINSPIGTLFIVGHGAPSGNITFGKSIGVLEATATPEQVAGAVRGALPPEYAPERVDFRSCNIGQNPKALERYRTAFGAKEAIAGTCFLAIEESRAIVIDGQKITTRSQLNNNNRKEFAAQLKRLPDQIRVKRCMLGTSEEAYFRAGGTIISVYSLAKGKPAVCYSKLPTQTLDPEHPGDLKGCKLIRVIAPAKKGQSEEGE